MDWLKRGEHTGFTIVFPEINLLGMSEDLCGSNGCRTSAVWSSLVSPCRHLGDKQPFLLWCCEVDVPCGEDLTLLPGGVTSSVPIKEFDMFTAIFAFRPFAELGGAYQLRLICACVSSPCEHAPIVPRCTPERFVNSRLSGVCGDLLGTR